MSKGSNQILSGECPHCGRFLIDNRGLKNHIKSCHRKLCLECEYLDCRQRDDEYFFIECPHGRNVEE